MMGLPNAESITSNVDTLPAAGFFIKGVIAPNKPIPVTPLTWLAGIKGDRFPKPVKRSARTTVWLVEDIRDLITKGAA